MSRVTRFTERQFTEALRSAVAERGEDYVYPSAEENPEWHDGGFGLCLYQTHDGEPACIIGLALHKIDPDLVPSAYDTQGAYYVLEGYGIPENVRAAAHGAQAAQDNGETWGQAFEDYLDTL